MDTNRIINMVLADLSLDSMKEQDNLEAAINSTLPVETKLTNVKIALQRMVMDELMLTKFQSLVTKPTETPNVKTNEQV